MPLETLIRMVERVCVAGGSSFRNVIRMRLQSLGYALAMTTHGDLRAEVDARVKLAQIVGTPASRRALRLRLGLTLQEVSDLTGLSITSIVWRESKRWRMTRGSVESPEGWAYIELLARAKGIALDV
jgi:hypothetical protein